MQIVWEADRMHSLSAMSPAAQASTPTLLCSITADKINLSGEHVTNDKSLLLAWSLQPGHQTKGFFIQRSRDGKAFKTIDFVPVEGSGKYSFTDINPISKAFTRLCGSNN